MPEQVQCERGLYLWRREVALPIGRSKQNVRDKVGPLVDNAGNIITQGFLMAE